LKPAQKNWGCFNKAPYFGLPSNREASTPHSVLPSDSEASLASFGIVSYIETTRLALEVTRKGGLS